MPAEIPASLDFTDTPFGRIEWTETKVNDTAVRCTGTIHNDDRSVRITSSALHETENKQFVRDRIAHFLTTGTTLPLTYDEHRKAKLAAEAKA